MYSFQLRTFIAAIKTTCNSLLKVKTNFLPGSNFTKHLSPLFVLKVVILILRYFFQVSKVGQDLLLKIVSVKLLVIVIIAFKRYPSTYCLVQGRCFICGDF